ncbi:methionine aminotransferase [Aureispira anguillae]|nr:methionine aminotransferase [Aureispira anguillae]
MNISSKLPNLGTTIFSVMSALANKHKAINLSQGFPNFDCDERLKNLVSHYVQKGFNQYCPMTGVPILVERLAAKIHGLYQVSYDPYTEINITSGATQAIFSTIHAFIHPNDEVIIVEPAYDCYQPSIQLAGGKVVPYQIKAPDWKINWEEFGQLITSKTRMIILNTPHNPSGSILEDSDYQALQQLVENSNILILSDEVYEHMIYDGKKHCSILSYPALRQRSLAVYSFGKTLHATGWKLGYIVADKALMKEFRKVHQFDVFSSNTPMQYAIADYLEDEQSYLGLPQFFQQKRDFFLDKIQDSPFQFTPSAGTYFQVADYSAISDEPDTEFAKRMTIEYGVAVIPLSVFYHDNLDNKVVRFCFAKTEDVLANAGALIRKIG